MEKLSPGQGGDAGELPFPARWSGRVSSRRPCLAEDRKEAKERAARVSEKRVILAEDGQCKDPEAGGAGLEDSRKSKEAGVAAGVSLLRRGHVREGRRGEVRSRRGNDTEGATLTQRAEASEGLEPRSEILWSVFSKSALDADWGTGPGGRSRETREKLPQRCGREAMGARVTWQRSSRQPRRQEVARSWASSERRSDSLRTSPTERQLRGGGAPGRGVRCGEGAITSAWGSLITQRQAGGGRYQMDGQEQVLGCR